MKDRVSVHSKSFGVQRNKSSRQIFLQIYLSRILSPSFFSATSIKDQWTLQRMTSTKGQWALQRMTKWNTETGFFIQNLILVFLIRFFKLCTFFSCGLHQGPIGPSMNDWMSADSESFEMRKKKSLRQGFSPDLSRVSCPHSFLFVSSFIFSFPATAIKGQRALRWISKCRSFGLIF